MNAISRQPTITAIRPPLMAPLPIASIRFLDSVSRTFSVFTEATEVSVSGMRALATSREPGAFITDAASK